MSHQEKVDMSLPKEKLVEMLISANEALRARGPRPDVSGNWRNSAASEAILTTTTGSGPLEILNVRKLYD